MLIKNLKNRLISLKKRSGKTWDELANESGISDSVLKKIVCGYTDNPRLDTYEKVLRFVDSQEQVKRSKAA